MKTYVRLWSLTVIFISGTNCAFCEVSFDAKETYLFIFFFQKKDRLCPLWQLRAEDGEASAHHASSMIICERHESTINLIVEPCIYVESLQFINQRMQI